jgi:Contractile injection system tube protein
MDLPNPFKLQKMTITALLPDDKTNRENPSQRFEAMFNPATYSVTYRNQLRNDFTLTPNAKESAFSGQEPISFSVRLLLDGTGVMESGLNATLGWAATGVKKQVDRFLGICYTPVEEKHSPNRLHVNWGVVNFNGMMESVTINYTLFDQTGSPLRAELEILFRCDETPTQFSSPDLTHVRRAKAGDTLPLLAKEIYGSSRYYLFVAAANGLDDFRNLEPGTELYFPPLALEGA